MLWLELTLTLLLFVSIFLTLVGRNKKIGHYKVFRVARAYLPLILVVFVVRAFLFQPFKVISGSLEPTVLIGDYLLVNQSAYGIRLPIIHKKVLDIGKPKQGDIALFHYPLEPGLVFVKRVIGIPGDHIEYRNKKLQVNGILASQLADGIGFDEEPGQLAHLMSQNIENLGGTRHRIFIDKHRLEKDIDITVPEGKYFVMGDNRDDSEDSRHWGFVDDDLLIGKAERILVSWDSQKHWFRAGRYWEKFSL